MTGIRNIVKPMPLSKRAVYPQLVELIGKPWPSEAEIHKAQSIFNKLQRIDAAALLEASIIEGVTPQVYQNIQELCLRGSSLTTLSQLLNPTLKFLKGNRLKEKKERIERLTAEFELFAQKATQAGVRFLVVKGGGLCHLYPDESWRTFSDIDLIISKDTVWTAINVFKEMGYKPKRVRLESYPFSDSVRSDEGTFGIAEMFHAGGKLKGYPFDLHFGAFPGCGDSIIESDLWEHPRSIQIGKQEVLMPSLEDCILIICSHISRHGYARLKDLNDTYVCLKQASSGLDWDYIHQSAKVHSFQMILYGLLNRLNQDYKLEIPGEFVSQLKPKRSKVLISKFLFKPGKANQSFHGGRKLFLGRFLQATFLYRFYRDQSRFSTAVRESLSGLFFLLQTGRPYRLWKRREILSFTHNRRIVIVPIEGATRKGEWRIHLQKVKQFALTSDVLMEWIGNEILVWNVGDPNELLLTPYGIYTQSAYNGDIDEVALKKIQEVAWDLIIQLKNVGAIEANVLKIQE